MTTITEALTQAREALEQDQITLGYSAGRAKGIAIIDAALSEKPEAVAFDAFLCQAWGETDLPAAELVPDWGGVRRFMVREWLGAEDATDYDGTNTLERLKADFDAHEADSRGAYSIEFEIGGVSIQRVCGFATHPTQQPEVQAEPTVTDAMVQAYLKANDEYWKRTDEMTTPPNKWRTGTPAEATRTSLIAALAAQQPAPQPVDERGAAEVLRAIVRIADENPACPVGHVIEHGGYGADKARAALSQAQQAREWQELTDEDFDQAMRDGGLWPIACVAPPNRALLIGYGRAISAALKARNGGGV